MTEETVDLSLTKYADDLVKVITAGAQGSAMDLAEAAWESKGRLDTELAEEGFKQNSAKEVSVLALFGVGSALEKEQFEKRRWFSRTGPQIQHEVWEA